MRRQRSGQSGSGAAGPVDAFWEWWASAGRAAAEAGISSGRFGRFTKEITKLVKAVAPGLAWELAPGKHAEHALVVTAAGVPELRRRAERWYRRAPAADEVWEYHPARQASPSSLEAVLEFGGHKLRLSELKFDVHVDNDRDVIDTIVFHPSFAKMPSEARAQVGFLALDWSLGEDGVARWIGKFDTADTSPTAGIPAEGLIEVAEALAARAGEPRWALLHGEKDGAVVHASLAVPAKWVDHPLLDQHVAVTVPFSGQTAEGLPDTTSLDELRELEDELTGQLRQDALLVGHETTKGTRTFHFYSDSDDPSAVRKARAAVSAWPSARVESNLDPGWRAIRHLTA
jgi:hypothetical protein